MQRHSRFVLALGIGFASAGAQDFPWMFDFTFKDGKAVAFEGVGDQINAPAFGFTAKRVDREP